MGKAFGFLLALLLVAAAINGIVHPSSDGSQNDPSVSCQVQTSNGQVACVNSQTGVITYP